MTRLVRQSSPVDPVEDHFSYIPAQAKISRKFESKAGVGPFSKGRFFLLVFARLGRGAKMKVGSHQVSLAQGPFSFDRSSDSVSFCVPGGCLCCSLFVFVKVSATPSMYVIDYSALPGNFSQEKTRAFVQRKRQSPSRAERAI